MPPDVDQAIGAMGVREVAFLVLAGAFLLAGLWARGYGRSATARQIRDELQPRWWVPLAALLGLTLALSRC